MAFKNGNQPNYERMLRLPQQLNNSIQVSQSRKYFIDIDVDVIGDKYKVISYVRECIGNNAFLEKLNFIDTKSGFHILIKKEDIPYKYNLMELIKGLRELASIKEAEFNKNSMCPIPGTMQSNHLVKFV
jgi:hypothetical protein